MNTFVKILEFIKKMHTIPIEIFKRFASEKSIPATVIVFIISILMMVSILALDLFIIYVIIMLINETIVAVRTKEIVEKNVQGHVVNKEYQQSSYTVVCTGKTVVPVFYPERFLIQVDYNGNELTFDNQEKYDTTEVGDIIQLVMIQNLDKNNNIIKVRFELD